MLAFTKYPGAQRNLINIILLECTPTVHRERNRHDIKDPSLGIASLRSTSFGELGATTIGASLLARINFSPLGWRATINVMVLRRQLLIGAGAAAVLMLAACDPKSKWHEQDISGALPSLALNMTDAMTNKPVTAADFRGKVVMLYFGYTQCPDFCPTTLTNLADVLQDLGPKADEVRVLFVTVDPNRDSMPVLKRYAAAFAPQVVGLRGTPDELAALARRYRVAYSVTPAQNGHPYEVTHSSIVYVFDQSGNARLLVDSMARPNPDVSGTTKDLQTLLAQHQSGGILDRILQIV